MVPVAVELVRHVFCFCTGSIIQHTNSFRLSSSSELDSLHSFCLWLTFFSPLVLSFRILKILLLRLLDLHDLGSRSRRSSVLVILSSFSVRPISVSQRSPTGLLAEGLRPFVSLSVPDLAPSSPCTVGWESLFPGNMVPLLSCKSGI